MLDPVSKRKRKHEPKRLREMRHNGMFETRSEAWEAAGLSIEVDEQAARRAWRDLALLVPLLIAVVVAHALAIDHVNNLKNGQSWFIGETPLNLLAAVAVLILGWLMSRDIALIAPTFFKRMDPSMAGTVEFLTRFVAVAATVLGALYIGGINPATLAVGGAFTAVVLGLAAQQTLGNLFAGMVLLTARPFQVGERVRLQAGAVGGFTEGIVSSLGLLYTTLARGEDRSMIPNSVVLAAVVVPLREPKGVDVRVRLSSGTRPSQVQAILASAISTETRLPGPDIMLEEIDGDQVVVRVQATPEHAADGARLADEIIEALANVTGEHPVVTAGAQDGTAEHSVVPDSSHDGREAPERSHDGRESPDSSHDGQESPERSHDGRVAPSRRTAG